MPLSDAHRSKLDGIVQQMTANGESESNIRAVVGDFKSKYADAAPAPDNGPHISAAPPPPSDTAGTGLGMLLRGLGSAPVVSALDAIESSPSLVKGARAAGNVLGPIVGMLKGGGLGALVGGSTGGRVGTLVGQGVQKVAGVASDALPAVAKAVSGPMAGALNVGDLAQMAEPNRRDIGVLGIGGDSRSEAERAAYYKDHPALINMLLQKLLGQ